MSSPKNWQEWIQTVTYKPGWKFHVRQGVTGFLRDEPEMLFIEARVPDVLSENPEQDRYRMITVAQWTTLEPWKNTDEAQRRAIVYGQIHLLEIHEVGEWLTIDGEKPWDPHADSLDNRPLKV